MGLHLYCIVPSGHLPPDDLTGVDDLPVESVETGPVAVWHSTSAQALRPSLPRIRAHDRVIRTAVSETVTPLPIRFGQWVPDPAGLTARISSSAEEYTDTLERVAGAVEFGVRLLDPGPGAGGGKGPPLREGPGAGRAYLRDLARRRDDAQREGRKAKELARRLQEAVGPHVIELRSEPGTEEGELLQAAHLVHRNHVDPYRKSLSAFRRGHPEVRTVVSGPWPPYSFSP